TGKVHGTDRRETGCDSPVWGGCGVRFPHRARAAGAPVDAAQRVGMAVPAVLRTPPVVASLPWKQPVVSPAHYWPVVRHPKIHAGIGTYLFEQSRAPGYQIRLKQSAIRE